MAAPLDLSAALAIAQPYQEELSLDRDKRRGLGSYYTPSYLVDLVLQRALSPRLEGATLDEILQLRVADLSCGGGIFLAGALQRIQEYCLENFAEQLAARWGDDAAQALPRAIVRGCIYGYDSDPKAVSLCRQTLAQPLGIRPTELAPNIQERDSLHDELDSFSVIVGNPPWGQKGYKFAASEKRALRERYRCGKGPLDPFKLFIERSIDQLEHGGRWGLVLPDILLLKNYEAIRRLILDSCELEFFGVAGQAFAGVNLDTVVVSARKGPAHKPVAIWHSVPENWREAAPSEHVMEQVVFEKQPQARFNLYLSPGRLRVLESLEACPRLGQLFEAHEGVHSGNCRTQLFVDSEPAQGAKLIVGGRELTRFKLAWAGRYIDLDPRAVDREAGHYANLGRAEWHRAGKIVVRRTGDRIIAALDSKGHYVSNNMFVVLPREGVGAEVCRAVVALLNSQFMTWYFRVVMPRTGRLFAELKICHLLDFPLPEGRAWVGGLAALAEAREGADSSELDARIDEFVLEAFGFGPGARREIAAGGDLAVPSSSLP